VSAREVVESFWAAMRANDWDAAAAHLADGFVVDWPCTGERITSRETYAEVLRRYPAVGRWSFDVHALVAEDDRAVTELTVSDGETAARDLHHRGRRRPDQAPGRVLADALRAAGLARAAAATDRVDSLSEAGGASLAPWPPRR
jgi:limonene-1,2-epoxide hydrolase